MSIPRCKVAREAKSRRQTAHEPAPRRNALRVAGLFVVRRHYKYNVDYWTRIIRTGNGPVVDHILLIDDDALLRDSLSFSLEQSGYRVSLAATAEEGLDIARRDSPDLVLLDIALPGMDGLQALHRFNALTDAPIIFLTARHRELDEVFGLELGAADYVTKPFATSVLLARIKATLRQSRRAGSERPIETTPLKVGDLVIDFEAHTVTRAGELVHLSPREFDLLHVLALEAGRVVRMEDLVARVWGSGYTGESQVVYVQVCWLREKVEEDPRKPRRILTVRGVGYKLEPQEQNEPC